MSRAYLVMLVTSCLMPAVARAELGGDGSLLEKERAQLHASAVVHQGGPVRDVEMSYAGGTIHQYSNAAGTIFAVTWRGRAVADLRLLLGTHFESYLAAVAKTRGKSHAVVDVILPDLVVRNVVHGRLHKGRAFLPGAIPAGVAVEELP